MFAFLLPIPSYAMSFFFGSDQTVYGQNDSVVVNVFLDTDSETVNTVSGEVYVGDTATIEGVREGNSSILFWIEKPKINTQENIISFSGIVPGGIQGKNTFLFSIVVNPKSSEAIQFSMKDSLVLLHDGLGTEKSTSFIPKTIFISDDLNFVSTIQTLTDVEAPEDFSPEIIQDPNLYDSQYVLVFATQDKGSGLDRYEVKEGFFGKYTESVSPYIIKNKNLTKTLFVKAIDRFGNERVAIVHPQKKIFNENFILIFSILVIVFISILYFRKRSSLL